MNILLISGNYPSKHNPTRGMFVYNLAQEFCNLGATVATIAPESLWSKQTQKAAPYGSEQSEVLRPRYVSFSNKTIAPGFSTGRLSVGAFTRSVEKAARGRSRPDIIYSHFLYPAGKAGLKLAQTFGVPCVVALGESSMHRQEQTHGARAVREDLHRFSHIITVSQGLRDYCVERMNIDPVNITVVPNAVDTDLFYPRDRIAVRKQLGLPQEAFIVTYLGHFNERKGYARVMDALRDQSRVSAIFIGDGPDYPVGKQVLFAGPLKHSEVPCWLAAGDIFVLPTLAEGYCNAVNEALAIGLPVVVSDIPALREQVDERMAMFVNPRDVGQIAEAIDDLHMDAKRRATMAVEAERVGQTRTLSTRAKSILTLLHNVIRQG